MIKQPFYIEVLKKLREKPKGKKRDVQSNNTSILHQDNTPVHIRLYVKLLLARKRITVLEHPPHSRYLAPYDFYLFFKGKNASMGTYFQPVKEVEAKTADLLKMMTPNKLQHCFERWETCIDREGDKKGFVHCFQ
ncbi:mariner Mos1 transposase [Trichonephila clavipes]|nr:mariner Mos1 transposase [Trichonephila clavipes]